MGLEKSANEKEIKKAYRDLALKYHPDKNPEDPNAEERFKEISSAYEILSNPQKKQYYDTYGHAGPQSAPRSGVNYDDIFGGFSGFDFESFFGGGRRRRKGPIRGQDYRDRVTISFMDSVKGAEKTISFKRPINCSSCDGTGAKDKNTQECSNCRGSGKVAASQGFMQIVTTCGQCHGKGRIATEKCPDCNDGRKLIEESFKVKIPAGVESGTRMRVQGKGAPSDYGGPPGDLYIDIVVKEHPRFKKRGQDIHSTEEIDYLDAILGSTKDIETIHGTGKLKIPAGTQPESILKIKKKGIISNNKSGDHLVSIKVKIPNSLSKEQKEFLIKLKELGQ